MLSLKPLREAAYGIEAAEVEEGGFVREERGNGGIRRRIRVYEKNCGSQRSLRMRGHRLTYRFPAALIVAHAPPSSPRTRVVPPLDSRPAIVKSLLEAA